MMARAILLASLVALLGLSVAAPTAAASEPPCLVGGMDDDPSACAVTFWTVVCVTDPCDTIELCVAYGRVCPV